MTAIIECKFPGDFNYKQIEIEDTEFARIYHYLSEGANFINSAL